MVRRSEFMWHWIVAKLLLLLFFCASAPNLVEAQIDCNNCGNNCGGCRVQFPDPPPIILQPPAPPPNNTCCGDCCGNNAGNAFSGGNYGGAGGYGSNCGGGDCCGNNAGNAFSGGNYGGAGGYGSNCGGCCCNGGNGGNYCGGDCCCSQQNTPQPLTNQNPNTPGGPQSRTNRCCQMVYTKCCGCGNNGGCCCQPCCCCGCCPCTPCCCCMCFPCSCCCDSCGCCDCCNDCCSTDFDHELGYRKRRRRRKRQTSPSSPSNDIPHVFHRLKPFQKRFYVLPLPMPITQEDVPPTTHKCGGHGRSHNHQHFHHHFIHCCPSCGCCSGGCSMGSCGQFNAAGLNPGLNLNDQCCSGTCSCQQCNCDNSEMPSSQAPQFNAGGTFQSQPDDFGCPNCNNQPSTEPCVGCNYQQNSYGQISRQAGLNVPLQAQPMYNGGCPDMFSSGFNPGFNSGFFRRLFVRRRKRQTFGGTDRVLNFLIPMFYKTPIKTALSNKCLYQKQKQLRPRPLPIKKQPYFNYRQTVPPPPFNQTPNMRRDRVGETKRCCCCCLSNKKRRKRR